MVPIPRTSLQETVEACQPPRFKGREDGTRRDGFEECRNYDSFRAHLGYGQRCQWSLRTSVFSRDNHGTRWCCYGCCWEFSPLGLGLGLEVTTVTLREWRLGGSYLNGGWAVGIPAPSTEFLTCATAVRRTTMMTVTVRESLHTQ